MNLIEQLQKAGIPLAEQEPMTRRTTFGIGGPALLLRPRSRAELQAAMTLCREAGEEPFILGRGSNLLVSDSGISRPVIRLDGDFTAITREGNTLRCGAGASLIAVCRAAAENSLSGIEWGYGIPGSLGGGVYMNAGAYGGEMKDILTEVTFLDEAGEYRTLPAAELSLSYRHSIFEDRPGTVIVEAVLTLTYANAVGTEETLTVTVGLPIGDGGRYVTLGGDATIYRMEETSLVQLLTLAETGLN